MTYVWTGFSDWFVRSQASTVEGRSVLLPVAYGVEAADSIITLCRLLPVDRGLITTQAVRSRVFFCKICPVPGSIEWISPPTAMHHGFGAMLWFLCSARQASIGHLPQFARIVSIAMFIYPFASGDGRDAQHALLLWMLAICGGTRVWIHFRCRADGTGTAAGAGGHGFTMSLSLGDALAIRRAGIDGWRVIGGCIDTSQTTCPAGRGCGANNPKAIGQPPMHPGGESRGSYGEF